MNFQDFSRLRGLGNEKRDRTHAGQGLRTDCIGRTELPAIQTSSETLRLGYVCRGQLEPMIMAAGSGYLSYISIMALAGWRMKRTQKILGPPKCTLYSAPSCSGEDDRHKAKTFRPTRPPVRSYRVGESHHDHHINWIATRSLSSHNLVPMALSYVTQHLEMPLGKSITIKDGGAHSHQSLPAAGAE